jgi:hypothetical protein
MIRPTPETDAVAAYEGNWDTKALRMTDHARRLEQQRDEAREAIQCAIDSYKKVKWGYDGCCGTSVIIDKLEDFLSKEGEK